MNEFADTMLAQRLSTVSGVAQIQIFGQQKYAVRAQLDPHAMATRGIGIDEVERALRDANPNMPTGGLQVRVARGHSRRPASSPKRAVRPTPRDAAGAGAGGGS